MLSVVYHHLKLIITTTETLALENSLTLWFSSSIWPAAWKKLQFFSLSPTRGTWGPLAFSDVHENPNSMKRCIYHEPQTKQTCPHIWIPSQKKWLVKKKKNPILSLFICEGCEEKSHPVLNSLWLLFLASSLLAAVLKIPSWIIRLN